MANVVNGHREEETNPAPHTTHGRTHGGHILPMLSFSASTPTEEDNPLDTNPVLVIDTPLWEQPEEGSAGDEHQNESGNPETVPLIDVSSRDVVLIDGPDDEGEEPDERAPLLTGGGGRSGGTGGMCSDDGDSGVGGLGIPVNMPRRSSSHIGIAMENGELHADMESTIAHFLRSKSESENLASSATTNSPDDKADKHAGNNIKAAPIGELREVASQLVSEVLSQAQVQATKGDANKVEEDSNSRIVDPHSDERLMEVVRRFVSDIMAAAKAEAWDSMRQIQNNNNNVLSLKEEAAAAASSEGGKSKSGGQNISSPTSTHPAERIFRGGPWYVQMGRVFSAFVSRICPCRCPTKP